MRYFLKLSYDGSGFHGWQSQPNAKSVQQTIEEAMTVILRHPSQITGAGRTDTGVNARCMYAHFDFPELISDSHGFLHSLNRMVGPLISIENIYPMAEGAHARFDAVERTYKYFISYSKSPFLRHFSWISPSLLNMEKLNEAARILLDVEDFTSFAKLHSDAKTNICDVRSAIWEEWKNEYGVDGICFTISADRFLRNMVRAIVGTLVDVGRGKITAEDFIDIINDRDRCSAGTSMPPYPLFLWDIKYPEKIFEPPL